MAQQPDRSSNVIGFIVEFDTRTDGWRQARAGYMWKTEGGAEEYRLRWLQQAEQFGWKPETRVVPLVRVGNALVSA